MGLSITMHRSPFVQTPLTRLARTPRPSLVALSIAVVVAMVLARSSPLRAEEQVILKSGVALRGNLAPIATLNQNPFAVGAGGEVKSLPLLLIDDGLKRMYVHRIGMVNGNPIPVAGLDQTIQIKQLPPRSGTPVQGIGTILGVSPFNDFGRREITVRGPDGLPLTIFQGITELNARYAIVEALRDRPAYEWDMRIATSSLRSDTLQRILHRRVANQLGSDREQEFDARLEIVRFFIETERFDVAREELQAVMHQFPEQQNMDKQLDLIVQKQALQLLGEVKVRAEAGQVKYAKDVLSRFPQNKIGRVTMQQVRDEQQKLLRVDQEVAGLLDQLRTHVGQLPAPQAQSLTEIMQEIGEGLSSETLARLNDYSRMQNSDNVPLENRVALAIAGWILGPNSGETNLTVAISLIKVRNLVSEYLGSTDHARREEILSQLKTLEGSSIEYVARMLPLIVPPVAWPDDTADDSVPGMYRVGMDAGGVADQTAAESGLGSYMIQLPPEYNPRREYPCIVALHAPGDTAENQLNWWAGVYDEKNKMRHGHATRNGYIVVAPAWTRPGQRGYEYTPREHQRVLASVRDAMRRSSIDADRVFLVGHADGGTAAWDIAVSHPDHWAGMISINAEPDKTIRFYEKSARYVPMYFVMGESAGTPAPLIRHGPILDKYLHARHDAMVVMYQGRGAEYFYEEIQDLFTWMNASTHRRIATPREFETATMREGDQYFWWLELGPLNSLTNINPILWDQAKRKVAGPVEGAVGTGNQIRFKGPTEQFTIWLRPDMGVDLNEKIVIRGGSSPKYYDFDGRLDVILEDARTRADRKRPFWWVVQSP